MSTLTILKNARETISDPNHWTQRADARSADGCLVGAKESDAVCWCAYGALLKAGYEASGRGPDLPYMELKRAMGTSWAGTVSGFNDSHTHEEVVGVFDRAIANLEAHAGEN